MGLLPLFAGLLTLTKLCEQECKTHAPNDLLEAGAVLVFSCVDLGTRFRCRRMRRVPRPQAANLSGAGGSETDEDQGCASDPGAALEAFQVHGVAGPAQEAHVPSCVPAGAAAVQYGGGGGQFRVSLPLFVLSVIEEATCISVPFSVCIHCVLGFFFESASLSSLKETAGSFGGAKKAQRRLAVFSRIYHPECQSSL
jgi:hypothetical protein